MPKLLATEGPLKGQTFLLQNATILGRSFDAEIRIDDLTVSRHHAKIAATDQGCLIEDMGSGNGTLVNDNRIQAPTPLADGDVVGISENRFRFFADVAPAGPQAGSSISVVDLAESKDAPPLETLDVRATMIGATAPPPAARPEELAKAHERLRTIVAISNAVQTQLDMGKLLDEIMDSLFNVFPQADRGFIMLRGGEGEDLLPKVARERGGKKAEKITVSRRIIDEAAKRGVAVLSADAMSDQRFSAAMSVMNFQIRSMMCAPLIANDDFLGVIHLDTTRQDSRFDLNDLNLFTGISNQTALAIANAEMHEKLLRRQRMERDLQLAREVQQSFLPDRPPDIPGLLVCASYSAALEVGGDFYDFVPLGETRVGIGLGDVAGKGIPAALMMARMSSDMRFFGLNEKRPADVIARINERVTASATEGAFVTAVFSVLDAPTRRLTIANAAHCPPLHRHAATGEVTEIQNAVGFPIGALDDTEYEQETLTLEPGDVISYFSDGITEAMNADKDCFGTERLIKAVAMAAQSPQEVMDSILAAVREWVGDTYQSDDLTLVCFGIAPERPPLTSESSAPTRPRPSPR